MANNVEMCQSIVCSCTLIAATFQSHTFSSAHTRHTFARMTFFPIFQRKPARFDGIAHHNLTTAKVVGQCFDGGKPGGFYMHIEQPIFKFSLRTIRMPQHVRAKFAFFLRMCAIVLAVLAVFDSDCCTSLCVVCSILNSVFTSFNDSHNGFNVFIFHRHFEQGHHFCCIFSN